jgi:hypothetical protein
VIEEKEEMTGAETSEVAIAGKVADRVEAVISTAVVAEEASTNNECAD